MRNMFLRSSFTGTIIGNVGREMFKRITLLLLLICCTYGMAHAAVAVTTGSGGTGICSNKAVTGSVPAFTSLGPIVITEGANSDFSTGTGVLVLVPPTGWQFSTVLPTLTYITGSNITGISGSITGTALTVNITVSAITGADQFTITGLQVQPLTTSAATGNIRASSVTGISGITTGSSGTIFAAVSVTSPVTATVSITASPSGSFCPGTNVTYTPSSTNGGTPTYTWALNGTDVSIGSTYSNSSLATGNTVSCRMQSSLTCVNVNPVYSNTITASVLTSPAAISGSNTICPTVTTTLNCTTSGGTWSSTHTSVATVGSTGIVTGVVTGTSTISYVVSGCAATKTVYVNAPPFAPALTPTVSTICNATSVAITAVGSPAATTILLQNFNTSLAPWTVDTSGSIGILPGSEWKACADSYLNEQGWYRSPDFTTFAMANADTSGSSATLSAKLISPTFSLAEYSSAMLSFQHAYDYWPAGDVNVNLEISTNGGSSWSTIVNFTGATIGGKMAFATATYSLNAYLGYPNVKIRFFYYSNFGYYWAIDNILITGTPALVTPTWSPTTYLYTDAGFTTPYTAGVAVNMVYVHPTSVTTPTFVTYTATSTQGACSSSATSAVTVNPSPGSTLGSLNLCVGTTTTLSNTAAGGTWVSSNASIATVGTASGIVTGVAAGTATMSYILGASCAALSVVTVNTTPVAIAGNFNVCLGYTSTLTNSTGSGTWSSSNTSIATVGSGTGVVSGISLGTATITYSLGIGCTATATVTVQPLPLAITGSAPICASQSVTLSDATSGGVWISGNTSIATAGYSTGVITGVAGGTVNISYALPTTGCFSIAIVTVNPIGPITGSSNACLGYTLALGNLATGGTWVSSNTSVGTIDATTGVLSGLALGTTNITYSLSTGCVAYKTVTVNALPADITGPTNLCVGGNITLSNTTIGGTWSSGNTAVAGVGFTTGAVSGIGAGTVNITYTATTGCFKIYTITVNPVPAALTGIAAVCHGLTTTLSNATSGGTWSSSNSSIASIGTSGIVTGESVGTATISYTLPTGCFGIRGVTVNSLPASIAGALAVCQGLTTTLTNATTGGNWSSANNTIATIGSSSGVALGGVAGTVFITYTLATGCIATATLTVNPLPVAISGSSTVCTGATTTLTNSTSGGTWSSSNTSLATVGSSGVVTGITASNATITYTLPTGCIATKLMTIYASPATITGTASVCEGQTTTLSSATSGGAWSSSNAAIGTIVSATGVLTGIDDGTVTITYMVSTGCIATTTATVLPLPAAITGNLNLCLGLLSTLGNVVPGGTWSSSATGIASIGSTTGIATAASLGMATISYTLATGCYTTATAVVNPLPSAVSGLSAVCVGFAVSFANATSGGAWASSDATVAAVGSNSGVVSGVSQGVAVISYILPTGCSATKSITVNPVPGSITGPNNICQAASATLSSTTSGGTWSSNTPSVAIIGSTTGIVSGVVGGATIISYILPTGCYSIMALTVTALPASIIGVSSLCEGGSALLTTATVSGSWSSSNTSVATIAAGTGFLSGISAGTTIITYMLPIGCVATKNITINPLPAAITGNIYLCVAAPSTLSNITPGGAWSSASPTVASINASTGSVTGFTLGTAVISYTLPTGCNTTTIVTVNLTPSAITGANAVCAGLTTIYSNVVGGGIWTSGNTSVATIGTSTGILSGLVGGASTITYTLSTGCTAMKTVTVNPLPAAISGFSAVCQGLSVTLTNTTSGGTWISGNTFVASVGATTGIVNGLISGTSTITYILPTGCLATKLMTVHALPAPLTGSGNLCLGLTTTLATTTGGGTWNSSNVSVATVDGSGVVSGVAIGTSVITYTLGIGCIVTKTVTVNPLPPSNTGSTPTCVGVNITLSNTTSGGTWSSTTSPGVATVNGTTGVVSPMSPGTAVVTYTLGSGCYATSIVTVNTVAPIIGNTSLCVGAITTLSHSTPGGTWSSSNTIVAGIGATSGIAVGYSVNTAIISYIIPGGCIATKVASVNALPASIGGSGSVCPGFTVTLTNVTSGGSWVSGNTSLAIIGSSSGIATGVNPGLVSISYTLPTGCMATRILTVNNLPAPISGTANICVGNTATLSTVTTGGTWSSNNISVATIGLTSGIVVGVSAGTAVVTYTPSSGCVSTSVVTVNAIPVAISGANTICAGVTNTLTNVTPGGTWSSTSTSIASIGSATGAVTGISPGTTIISYTTGLGCATSMPVTVNIMPAVITGAPSVCSGYTTSLASTPAGGAWSSSNPSAATVDATGLVSGISVGTTNITYGFTSGCRVQVTVTVSTLASAISGTTTICEASNTTLSDPASGGGTWSCSNTFVATIGSISGVMSGVGPGTATVTYTIGSGCSVTASISVNPIPAVITGIPSTCIGMTTTLSTTTTGGYWTSSNLLISGVLGGVVSGVSVGVVNITYHLLSGCNRVQSVTVNPMPSAISGITNVCEGLTTSLSNTVTGGIWSSTATGVASVNAVSGVVTGVSGGTSVISYLLGAGCVATTTVDVYPLPLPISGTTNICQGLTETFSSLTPGGTWTSSNTLVATIGSGSGLVTGITSGTAIITYTIGSGCITTVSVTVNPFAPNTGSPNTCVGYTTTLANSVGGGTWSSGSIAIATVGAGTGIVMGVSPGTSVITYSLPSGCSATSVATVIPLSPITGPANVCVGLTTTLSNAATGGVWSSSNTLIATVDVMTGTVVGVATGTANISYTFSSGCLAVITITVHPLSSIVGSGSVCVGQTTTLTNATPGGTWSSSNISVATINVSTGLVNGISAGGATITYSLPTSCMAVTNFTVNPLSPISGTGNICVGTTATLTNTTPGGTWTSNNLSIATINSSSGIVTGITAGSVTIKYTLGSGCFVSSTITVNPLPSAITGNPNVCHGGTTTLSNSTGGGVWSSSNASVATVVSSTGVVTGVAPGNSVIFYLLSTGCYTTAVVTVNSLPAAITGTPQVCDGFTTTLSNTVSGGTWSSSNAAIATVVLTTGLVTGIVPGTATITYMLGTGCISTVVVTVNSLPLPISGASNVCVGANVPLSSASTGGTWSSSNISIATILPSTGIATGVFAGTVNVSYTLPTGCFTTTPLLVNPLPAPITGASNVCIGLTTSLANATPGGTWGSADVSIAIINAAGIVSGISAGTATVSYSLITGCYTTTIITVNGLPAAISGTPVVCEGLTTTLTSSTSGGTWSCLSASIATVTSTGVVSGISAGVAAITYTLPTGCTNTVDVTVNPLPAVITGITTLCAGQTSPLYNTTTGGIWSSSSSAIADADAVTGIVTGLSSGNAVITYSLPTGCIKTTTVTVNLTPLPISGAPQVCVGATTVLSNATPGGLWSSSSPSIATITTSGTVNGAVVGTTTISYSLPTGCRATVIFTVNPNPPAITGATGICPGSSITLNNSITGGIWSTTSTDVSVNPTTGVVTGIAPGLGIIVYTLPTGCNTNAIIVVNPPPTAITGTASSCQGTSSPLANTTAGGTWLSSNVGIAVVGSASGIATGLSAGTAVISYMLPTGCAATRVYTVNPLPAAITGATAACLSTTMSLVNTTPGGAWTSGDVSVATINSLTGALTGVSLGTSAITYTLPTGCRRSVTVTVNPVPMTVSGTAHICLGYSTVLSSATSGGTWSSTNTSVATIGAGTGVVIGSSAGITIVSYSLATGCATSVVFTVNPLAPITGSNVVCTADTAIFSNAVPGGAWVSSTPGVATVSGAGLVYGVAPGVAIISYTLGTGCIAIRSFTVNQLPVSFVVTGGGTFCVGGTGVPVGLNTSATGFAYSLFNASTSVATVAGTGLSINYGLQTAAGTYTVRATNLLTGCMRTMLGSAVVSPVTMAPAAVYITTATGDTVCNGTSVTFSQTTFLGGSSPAFQWFVNGLSVGTSSTYTYSPVNGDVVKCKLHSSASCAVPDTASNTKVMTVLPSVIPSVNVALTPNDTLCTATATSYTAIPTFGGTMPVFNWTKNGAFAGTGMSYGYTPTNGDVIHCEMVSNERCRVIDTAHSMDITMTVMPYLTPSVTINATPGFNIVAGAEVVFNALVANAGISAIYQWRINGIAIGGGAGPTFTWSSFTNNDTISCTVTSTGICAGISTTIKEAMKVQSVGIAETANTTGKLTLFPNPNTGVFTIKGKLNTVTTTPIKLQVTDVLGQVVFEKETAANNGTINEPVITGNTLANGMYILTLHTSEDNYIFHFVVRK